MLRCLLRVQTAEPLYLQLFRTHLAVPRKAPAGSATITDQFYRLELDLAAKLASSAAALSVQLEVIWHPSCQ